MYERFTDRARSVMQLANQEAQRFNLDYIGTEHIFLGLVREGSGIAATALKNLGMDLRRVRLEVEKLVQPGPNMVTMGKLPQTPKAKKAIEYAIEEARNLNHNYVGTEHLLLGLLREQEGVAAQVLINLGFSLERVRQEVLDLLGRNTAPQPAVPHPRRVEVRVNRVVDPELVSKVLEELARIEQLCRELENRIHGPTQEARTADTPAGEPVRPTCLKCERHTHRLLALEYAVRQILLAFMLSLAILVLVGALFGAFWFSTTDSGPPVWWGLLMGMAVGVLIGLAIGSSKCKVWDYFFEPEEPRAKDGQP